MRDPSGRRLLREVGQRIASVRTANRQTQETAAAMAGIDYKRWQRLEQGTVNPTVRTLSRVASALGMDFWRLMERAEHGKASDTAQRATRAAVLLAAEEKAPYQCGTGRRPSPKRKR